MNLIVMDLEWNQSNTGREDSVKLMPFEIIEIGAIKLDEQCEMLSEYNELVRPQVYREMHQITSKLIHLQMNELERGRDFKEVAGRFLDWCGEEYIICTWGNLDLIEFQRNLRYYDMPPLSQGPIEFLDVQKLFSIAYEDHKSRKSLEYAVDCLKIEKDIPFHRAFSDAYYTAKILAHIFVDAPEVLGYVSYDVFHPPMSKKDEIKITFDTYSKYISRCFEDKSQAMKDREVCSTKCYLCHKNLRKKIRWFTPNGKHYYSVAYCDKHGYMKGKVRMHKSDNGVFVVKTTKFISEDEMDRIQTKKEHVKEIRKKPGNN